MGRGHVRVVVLALYHAWGLAPSKSARGACGMNA